MFPTETWRFRNTNPQPLFMNLDCFPRPNLTFYSINFVSYYY